MKDYSRILEALKKYDSDEKKERLINTTIEKHLPDLLLMPPLVKALHGVCPRDIKGDDWWLETRQAVYKTNNYHCVACGVHKSNAKLHQWLEAHEYYQVDYANTKYTLKDIIPLCHCCHAFIHYQRTTAMLNCGKINKDRFDTIMEHGKTILLEIGANKDDIILPEEHFPENNGKWNDWYLEFEGVKHYSRFKNYQEWEAFYTKKDSESDK